MDDKIEAWVQQAMQLADARELGTPHRRVYGSNGQVIL